MNADSKNLSGCRLLSVIMPLYNGAQTLSEQLNALKAQKYEGDWEIVAVDNGSIDNSDDIIREHQKLIPNLQLVYALEKQSKGYACNVGARAARGDALIFCDQDDVVAPGWLAAFAEAFKAHDFVAGTLNVERLNQAAPWRPVFSNGADHPILGFLPHVSGCNLGISRQTFEAVGGFSEDFPISDDIDLSWRLQLQGYTIGNAPEAVIYYRYRQTYWGLWQQIKSYAEAQPHLYRRFATHGMPRSSTRKALQTYQWLIKKAPVLLRGSNEMRARWIFKAAACWGRLRGSVRYRTFYL
jgi:GT2 family glycosyltransferase